MSAGKLASQAGHAFLDAYLLALQVLPAIAAEYRQAHHGIKVCLAAGNLDALQRAHDQAVAAGIPAAMVTDLGYTCFNGRPTITALGIGPARQGSVRHITKRFPLLP